MSEEKKKKTKEQLPKGAVELDGEGGFTIKLEKIKKDELHDQLSISKEGIGCFNNPGGPSC